MSSWVRYSVAVYAGLLFAGSMLIPKPEASALTEWVPFAAKKQERVALPQPHEVHVRRSAATPLATTHDLSKTLEQRQAEESVEDDDVDVTSPERQQRGLRLPHPGIAPGKPGG